MADRDRIPDWLLERALLDEIPGEHRNDVAQHLAGDPDTAVRLDELRESNREILAAVPPEQAVQEIERRHRIARAAESSAESNRSRRSPLQRWMFASTAVAAAGALALFVFVSDSGKHDKSPPGTAVSGNTVGPLPTPTEDVRRKGDPVLIGDPLLILHRKRGESIEPLDRKSVAQVGDLIQISYRSSGYRHGVILSIDGRGEVTLHYPDTENAATLLEVSGKVKLKYSYELDDAPGFERFFFITSQRPVDVNLIMSSARELAKKINPEPKRVRTASLDLASDMYQWSFLLDKEDN
ncbi:MAG: DUF4384 domain-containing protein [Proteobacteria bacterium]|nr:DUF4384 domain-containing protein [Pseudomonadota bacterium]